MAKICAWQPFVLKPSDHSTALFALPRAQNSTSKRLRGPDQPQIARRTSVKVVIAHSQVCLTGLLHVAEQIDGYLNDIAPHWTLESASEAGFTRLLSRLFSGSGCSTTQQISRFERAIHQAATVGHVPVLAWWCLEFLSDQWNGQQSRQVFEIAASRGHLPVIQWLHDQDRLHSLVHGPAVACNHPEIVYWLYDQKLRIRLTISINKAIQHRQLEFLEWVVAHDQYQLYELTYTPNATVLAATQGDLPSLRWLRANRPNCCFEWALSYAGMQGHLHAVMWLHAQYPDVDFIPPGSHVIRNEHTHVVQWMLTRFRWRKQQHRIAWINEMMECAIDAGHFKTVRYLHYQRMGSAFSVSVGRCVLSPIEWLHGSLWQAENAQELSIWTSLLRFSLLQFCGVVLQAEANVVRVFLCSRKLLTE